MAAFISEVRRQLGGFNLYVRIVNNTTSVFRLRNLDTEGPADLTADVRVLNPGLNLGYFGAAHFAFCQYRAERPCPEWTIVANTDIVFDGDDFIQRLVTGHALCQHAVVAPRVLSLRDGRDQNPFSSTRPSKIRVYVQALVVQVAVGHWLHDRLSVLIRTVRRLCRRTRTTMGGLKEIYAAHGAFLVLHRSFFENGGTLDHGTFLYGEEISIAEQVRERNLRMCYDRTLAVYHAEHQTTGRSRIAREYNRRAALYVARRFFWRG